MGSSHAALPRRCRHRSGRGRAIGSPPLFAFRVDARVAGGIMPMGRRGTALMLGTRRRAIGFAKGER
jgi:hypothetical protein